MTSAAETFSTLIGQVAQSLARRFRRRGSHLYTHEPPANWAVVEFQKARRSTSEIVIFTINIGVASDRLLDFFTSRRAEQVPVASEWHWRQRLGFLLPDEQDRWWSLAAGEPVDHLARELSSLLTDVVVSTLNRYADEQSLVDLWLTGQSPGLTELQRLRNLVVLLHALGPPDRYESTLKELARRSPATATFVSRKLVEGEGPRDPA